MPDRSSAEEVYSRCLGNATTLGEAAHRFAGSGDTVSALATAWGADVYSLQAVLWERIMVAASMPTRQFFRVAEALTAVPAPEPLAGAATAADVLTASRTALLSTCDPALRGDLQSRWTDAGFLAALGAPSRADLDAAVMARTGGVPPEAFVEQRRRQGAQAMADAQSLRIKGEAVPAIESAYDSDVLMLEAYLVESACAVGDTFLLTVTCRWELATRAVATLPGLPEGFLPAVLAIRQALSAGLGDADGERMRESLIPA